jgi:uncharacterized protein involved in exopolysaccharide biosynthesis
MTRCRTRLPGGWLLVIARLVFDECVRARVVTPAIADLQAEWLAAGTNRIDRLRVRWRGYWAFWSIVAISPVAFSRWSEERAVPQVQRSYEMTAASPIRLVLILTVAGLGAGYVYGSAQPILYRSIATIQAVPPRVADAIVKASAPVPLADRLRATEAAILSRSRLERLIKEFSLYPEQQKAEVMDDVLARMRRDIRIAPLKSDVFQVQYTGQDPVTVMKVTERLAALFLEESLKDGQRRTEGTVSFLEARIKETADRLVAVNAELEHLGRSASAMPKRLELEVIQSIYKNLLMQREEGLGMQSLQRRQIAEQFVLLDPARVTQRPIGPPRFVYTLGGGVAGVIIAVLYFVASFTRRYIGRRGDVAGARA